MSELRKHLDLAGAAIHHIDGNPRNNDLSNLQVISMRDNGPARVIGCSRAHCEACGMHTALDDGALCKACVTRANEDEI